VFWGEGNSSHLAGDNPTIWPSGLVLFGLLKATSWLTDCLSRMTYPDFVSHMNPCSPSSWIYKIPFCLVKSWISSYPFVSHDINHKSDIAFYSHDIPFKSQLYPCVWWSNPNHIAELYPQSRSGWWFGTWMSSSQLTKSIIFPDG